jgi:hypothetical protein
MSDQPYLKPLLGGDSPSAMRELADAASREASKEEMSYLRAVGKPRTAAGRQNT